MSSRGTAVAGFLLAAVLPVLLWHDLIGRIASRFELDAGYLVSGWTPWVLMGLGLLCFLPVAFHDLRSRRDRRFHRRAAGGWAGWGTTLYLLGFVLATQVSQIADGFSRG